MSRTQLVPASYVFLLRPGPDGAEVLLHLRQATGYLDGHWATLAGHVESGETAREAAVREVFEESGVHVDDLEPLTAVHRVQPGGPPVEQRVDFFWRCTSWTGEPAVQEPAKNGGFAWYPLVALPEPLVPQEAAVLHLLRDGAPVPAILCR